MTQPAHSPLGASGAERWMNCPGSAGLIQELQLPESDEPEYRKLGTHAHSLAALCLETGTDCWEHAGTTIEDIEVSVETCNAVQLFLDECRSLIPTDGLIYHTIWIEKSFSSPIHPLFYGTTDFAILCGTKLYVRDYKHGEGLEVDAVENPQIRYYGYGILQDHPEVEEIDYAIVQPRFYGAEKIKRWSESAASLQTWVNEELVPAMLRTELDNDLLPGSWCRFCPAKLVCPVLTGLFRAAATADPKLIVTMSDAQLDRDYPLVQAVKFYLKALEEQQFARLNAGKVFANSKLVKKKADRVWKPGAEVLFKERFGQGVFTVPELKSPAQMEKISEPAKELVHEWAYTPDSGLTCALRTDKRGEVKVQTAAEIFKAALAAVNSGDA